jgi:hypothetical protein
MTCFTVLLFRLLLLRKDQGCKINETFVNRLPVSPVLLFRKAEVHRFVKKPFSSNMKSTTASLYFDIVLGNVPSVSKTFCEMNVKQAKQCHKIAARFACFAKQQ